MSWLFLMFVALASLVSTLSVMLLAAALLIVIREAAVLLYRKALAPTAPPTVSP